MPSTSTVPEVGVSSPRIRRASVDLPQPDSPTMPSTLPAGTLNVTSSTAITRFSAFSNPPLDAELAAQVLDLDRGAHAGCGSMTAGASRHR